MRLMRLFPHLGNKAGVRRRREAKPRDGMGGVDHLLPAAKARDDPAVIMTPANRGAAGLIGCSAIPLIALPHVGCLIRPAHIAIGIVAGCFFQRSRFRRILRGRQHRHGLPGNRHRAARESRGKERHAHQHEPGDRRGLCVDRANAGVGAERHAALRHSGGGRFRPRHADHVQDHIKWTPGREIEESRRIALERRQPGLRHEEQRKNDREHGEEDHRQHHVQDRHPSHRLLGDAVIGVAGLDIGACLGKSIDRAPAHIVPGLHERVDRGVLPHGFDKAVSRFSECLIDDRQVTAKLGLRDRFAELGIKF